MFSLIINAPCAFARFGRAKDGATAVEFSIVAIPFFMVIFAMAEISMVGFAQTSLNFAVSETARQIRTGQAQMSGMTGAQIQNQICSQINGLIVMTCEGNLYLDVDRYASFTAVQNNNPIQNGTFNPGGMGYSDSQPSDIVVVRAYYRWKVITPLFDQILSNSSGGERILVSTMMFRNEPYQ